MENGGVLIGEARQLGRWRKRELSGIFPVSTGQAAGDKNRSGYTLLRVFVRTVMEDGGNFGRGGRGRGGSFIDFQRSDCGAGKSGT
jgi:hypothetical protein